MRALLLDTAGPVVGVAAFRGSELVGWHAARVVSGADAFLLPRAAELLDVLGGLDRVAVSVGPGAFTGLRVGVAAALGLALGRGVGVAPLSSLAVRAAAAPGHACVLAVLDARKGRVYAGRFDTRGALPRPLDDEADVPPEVAARGPSALATGEGAAVHGDVFTAHGHLLHADAVASPVAACAALVAAAPLLDPGEVGLRYLREPDARPPGG
jgi:tRNA threonylcarbamoyladenosine biosynthesis protein TsaB